MTSVPLNEILRRELCAKPTPATLTIVPRGPEVADNVIDVGDTVNGADSVVGVGVALSVTVIVALPGTVVGVVIMILNVPAAEDFG